MAAKKTPKPLRGKDLEKVRSNAIAIYEENRELKSAVKEATENVDWFGEWMNTGAQLGGAALSGVSRGIGGDLSKKFIEPYGGAAVALIGFGADIPWLHRTGVGFVSRRLAEATEEGTVQLKAKWNGRRANDAANADAKVKEAEQVNA